MPVVEIGASLAVNTSVGSQVERQERYRGSSMGRALFEHLSRFPILDSLVGTRVFPNAAPEGMAGQPYLIYRRMDFASDHHLKGASGLAEASYEIDAVAPSAADAADAIEQVRQALDGLHQTTIGVSAPVVVRSCRMADLNDTYVEKLGGRAIDEHRARARFDFWHDVAPTAASTL